MDIITYALSKKIAAHALSGVQSMSVSGQTLTINTKDSGVLTITFPTPKDGVSVTDIDVNANNQIVFTMSDGTEIISGKIPTVKGDKGDPGVSPIITENADNTDKIYKLDITTADSTFTTPNLKGADGQGGTGGPGEENIIDSISVNGVNVTPDENKNVDITVPNIYVGDTEPIDDNIEVWFNPNGESSSIDVPIEKIKVNGELQTPVNKVVDITVPDAYDDTDIRAELANKSDTDHTHTTVNGHTVESDVPVDAKFTDTVYDDTEVKESINEVNDSLSVIGKCKNLLKPTLQTTTKNGVTCTNNGDGTYTLNGTASADTYFNITSQIEVEIGKKYKLCCTTSDDRSKYNAYMEKGLNGFEYLVLTASAKTAAATILVRANVQLNNILIKPMLTTDLSATYDDFVPYTGDGETLASDVAEIKNDLGGLTFSASGTTLSITDGTHTWTLGANS